jgi:hypothetical protein
MTHRIRGLAATCLLAAGALLATAPPAQASSTMQLVKVVYDAAGYPDSAANSSVNGEYVVVRNAGTTTRCLEGWTIRDVANHVYTVRSFCIGAGKSFYLHSGKGTDTATHRFWGSGWHIWNNTGDTAYLRNASGVLADSCRWTTLGRGYVYC